MTYLIAAPEMMTAAATDLATIASNVNAAHMVAAARATSVIPAAADEVSVGIAQLFSQHAANYQALAGQAAEFSDQFVQHLAAAAFSYADIEAALANLLQFGLQFGDLLSEIGNLIFTGLATAFASNPVATILEVAAFLLLLPVIIPLEIFFFIPLAVVGLLVGSLFFI